MSRSESLAAYVWRGTLVAALAAGMPPGAIVAQSAGVGSPSPAASAAASVAPVAPALLSSAAAARVHPLKWVYVASLVSQGATPQRLGFRTLQVSAATFDGTPAWLVVDERQLHAATLAESLYVAQRDLSPLHRILRTPSGRVTSDFGADSIRTAFDDDRGHQAAAMASEPRVLANLYLLEAVLGASPLDAAWRASARLATISRDGGGIVPIETRTVGEERVLIPDGAFDTWVVSLRVGQSEERFWVRKSDGVVVRERIPVVNIPDAQVELILALGGVGKAP